MKGWCYGWALFSVAICAWSITEGDLPAMFISAMAFGLWVSNAQEA